MAKEKENKEKSGSSERSEDTKDQPITKDMLIGEVVREYPEAAEVMFEHGMHCVGCHVAAFETIEQGASAHGINVEKLVEDLNKAAKKSKK